MDIEKLDKLNEGNKKVLEKINNELEKINFCKTLIHQMKFPPLQNDKIEKLENEISERKKSINEIIKEL